jgi:hypothetical protein
MELNLAETSETLKKARFKSPELKPLTYDNKFKEGRGYIKMEGIHIGIVFLIAFIVLVPVAFVWYVTGGSIYLAIKRA